MFSDVTALSSCWSRTTKRISTCWEDKALDHYWLVAIFFFNHVVLMAADIITDILQAKEHFQNGHPRWGWATLGFIVVRISVGSQFFDFSRSPVLTNLM